MWIVGAFVTLSLVTGLGEQLVVRAGALAFWFWWGFVVWPVPTVPTLPPMTRLGG